MGREIDKPHFKSRDYHEFRKRLERETEILGRHFSDNTLAADIPRAGLELELWLVDDDFNPAPVNQAVIAALNEPLICPELAKFNIEINTRPQALRNAALSRLPADMQDAFDSLLDAAKRYSSKPLMIGILPTARLSDFCLDNMSEWNRYRALNEQLLRSREGQPLTIEIEGTEQLRVQHRNVMLESAATSYQIHLKVPPSQIRDYFNAALVVSAPMVAIASNSPLFLGSELWEETRIPLFEQSIRFGDFQGIANSPIERVSFGDAYLQASAFELFEKNLAEYPILLPICEAGESGTLAHLRLHNGTVWRWNRVLIDFDGDTGPGLRIEHRPSPAGPSIEDMVANTAFYYGLVHDLASSLEDREPPLPFEMAKRNFYATARYGLSAEVSWMDGQTIPVRRLILEELIPAATRGLASLHISPKDIDRYLKIVEARTESGRTGAYWQKQVYRNNGHDLAALTRKYFEHQQDKSPVHLWSL